jgi:hypothetical protein
MGWDGEGFVQSGGEMMLRRLCQLCPMLFRQDMVHTSLENIHGGYNREFSAPSSSRAGEYVGEKRLKQILSA